METPELEAKMKKLGGLHNALVRARAAFQKQKTYENAVAIQKLLGQIETLRETLPKLRLVA